MPFEKGHEKIGGRQLGAINKRTEIKQAIGNYAETEGLPALRDIARNDKTPLPIKKDTIIYLIDRELGKPKIMAEVDTTHRAVLSWEHLEQISQMVVKALSNG